MKMRMTHDSIDRILTRLNVAFVLVFSVAQG